jgi:hypothetical protein
MRSRQRSQWNAVVPTAANIARTQIKTQGKAAASGPHSKTPAAMTAVAFATTVQRAPLNCLRKRALSEEEILGVDSANPGRAEALMLRKPILKVIFYHPVWLLADEENKKQTPSSSTHLVSNNRNSGVKLGEVPGKPMAQETLPP